MESCKICGEPLVVEFDRDDEDDGVLAGTQTVPDDLQLSCGDHFHWQCLLDTSPTLSISLTCPSCSKYLPTNAPGPSATNPFLATTQPSQGRIPATYINEGGTQHDLDLLPLITEEAFLAAHPETRPARAFHILCAAGDVGGVVELWRDVDRADSDSDDDDDDDGEAEKGAARLTVPQLIRWQDPLSGMQGALHVAVAEDQEEVAWLLLWAGSRLETARFPAAAAKAASTMGIAERPQVIKEEDIRALRDSSGRTAGDLAAVKGSEGVWARMIEAGIFDVL